MDTLKQEDGESLSMVQENIEALKAILPSAFTEDGIDFEVLRQLLGDEVAGGEEKYGLNWHGKKKARQIALTPSSGTLRPCPEESVEWQETRNLAIEGDNLEVLKLLQRSYAGRIKMIYIDPPYNTGKGFIYPDRFKDNLETYLKYTNQRDAAGLKISSNVESSGRYHTNWLNMMYPRLKVSRSLLSEDGAIFVSINQKEVSNLKMLLDEIFGEENLLCVFSWRTDGNFDNQAKFKYCHEYILAYAKREESFPHPLVVDTNVPIDSKIFRPEIRNTIVKNGPKNPPSAIKLPVGMPASFEKGTIKTRTTAWPHYNEDAEILDEKLQNEVSVYSGWSSKELLLEFIRNDCRPITDQKGQSTRFEVIQSGAIEAVKDRGESSHVISSLCGLGGPQRASKEVEKTGAPFDDYPKPLALIEYLAKMINGDDFIVMDFFAGSGTTAHAIMNLNATDNGTRSFISIQLPETTKQLDDSGNLKETTASKAGYENIFDISVKRLIGARDNLISEGKSGDFGFKVFKLDSSNIRAWNPDASDLEQTLLDHAEHLVEGRSERDVLFELLLKRGVDLTVPIEERAIARKTVYSIGYGVLFACLDEIIDKVDIEKLAKGITDWHKELKPAADTQVVFRDSAFADDIAKTNMTAILEQNGIAHIRSL